MGVEPTVFLQKRTQLKSAREKVSEDLGDDANQLRESTPESLKNKPGYDEKHQVHAMHHSRCEV